MADRKRREPHQQFEREDMGDAQARFLRTAQPGKISYTAFHWKNRRAGRARDETLDASGPALALRYGMSIRSGRFRGSNWVGHVNGPGGVLGSGPDSQSWDCLPSQRWARGGGASRHGLAMNPAWCFVDAMRVVNGSAVGLPRRPYLVACSSFRPDDRRRRCARRGLCRTRSASSRLP